MYSSSHIADDKDLREAILRMAVSEFGVFVPSDFSTCTRDGPGFRWEIDARFCVRGARRVLFPLSTLFMAPVDDKAFMKLFDDWAVASRH